MALSDKELSAADLRATQSNWVQYSKQHSKNLPPGSITDFEWKDYCPKAFRLLQELDNIDNGDYMMSVCSDETIRKASSTLRPGNLFLLSNDSRFAIKTLRKSQLKVYFVVVANIFKSDLLMHRCYDLKGSLQGRKVKKMRVREKTLHKESDLDFLFYLEPLVRHRLLAQIKHDCAFLEAVGIMNYSLLLGFHIKESPQGFLDGGSAFCSDFPCRGSADSRSSCNDMRISNDMLHQSDLSSQRSSISSNRDSIDSRNSTTELTFCDHWLQNNSCTSKFGEEMSARGVRISWNGTGSVSTRQITRRRECHDVLLYFGIVDFFQDYGVIKRIEHAYKSLQFDPKMIAAVNPKVYSSRFQAFISDLFKADDSLH
ncbi:phosphatidylinositol 4-phosphate 5-kinase 10 isoform X2 [Herrania umbratica]|uniref:1-phosphatidylinositol-4-phosphate 5-kinase n=1 Tax=Herrania umbratica TaxID=108875 RepID=A0A6J0ZYA7_9ROSI|nr:phosphatidylinositol 4-phosphate 5-kinase 10 isoform X2 [Herrania umbratica]